MFSRCSKLLGSSDPLAAASQISRTMVSIILEEWGLCGSGEPSRAGLQLGCSWTATGRTKRWPSSCSADGGAHLLRPHSAQLVSPEAVPRPRSGPWPDTIGDYSCLLKVNSCQLPSLLKENAWCHTSEKKKTKRALDFTDSQENEENLLNIENLRLTSLFLLHSPHQ